MIVISWSIFTIIIITSFSANLTAFLTESKQTGLNSDLEELINYNKLIIIPGSALDYFLAVNLNNWQHVNLSYLLVYFNTIF